MKLEITDDHMDIVPDEEVNYLALDADGQLWMIGEGGGVFLSDDGSATIYRYEELLEAFKSFGPFKRFNGKITLSND